MRIRQGQEVVLYCPDAKVSLENQHATVEQGIHQGEGKIVVTLNEDFVIPAGSRFLVHTSEVGVVR